MLAASEWPGWNKTQKALSMTSEVWKLGDFFGYISTWSAAQRLIEAGREDILETFFADLSRLWGPDEHKRPVTWSINMRLGRV
ncbi:MAG: hypothetical protein BGO99_10320 [Nitrosospira sp. 56-18]|nr:MAG: hypothetical protein BGO99_10320 [Nitrosospira sp. 56-18]